MAKLDHLMCDRLFKELDIATKRAVMNVVAELNNAIEKHPFWPTSENNYEGEPVPKGDFVHAAAIVAEESGELIRASLNFAYEDGPYYEMHKEAIQTGAMAIRFLIEAPEVKGEEELYG